MRRFKVVAIENMPTHVGWGCLSAADGAESETDVRRGRKRDERSKPTRTEPARLVAPTPIKKTD